MSDKKPSKWELFASKLAAINTEIPKNISSGCEEKTPDAPRLAAGNIDLTLEDIKESESITMSKPK